MYDKVKIWVVMVTVDIDHEEPATALSLHDQHGCSDRSSMFVLAGGAVGVLV